MAVDHLHESSSLDYQAPRLEQILDVDIIHIEGGAVLGDELEGLEEILTPRGRDEVGAAGAAAPLIGVEDLARPLGLEAQLEPEVLAELARRDQLVELLGQRQLHAVLADDELAAAVAVAEGGAPGQVVDLAGEARPEVAGLRAEGLAAAPAQGRLLVADPRPPRPLLRVQLLVRAPHVVPRLRRRRPLPRVVALVHHRQVQDVPPQRQVQVLRRPRLEALRLVGWEAEDGQGYRRRCFRRAEQISPTGCMHAWLFIGHNCTLGGCLKEYSAYLVSIMTRSQLVRLIRMW